MRACAFVPPSVDDPPIERSERLPSVLAPRGVLDLRFGLRSELGPEDPRGVRPGDVARLRPDEPFGFATSTLSAELKPFITAEVGDHNAEKRHSLFFLIEEKKRNSIDG